MIYIKCIKDIYNGPISFTIGPNIPLPEWNDDGIRYNFFNYKDENIKLKDNDKFKIFDNLTNKWCYFQYHISKFDDNKLIYPEYIEPIEYWFTKKDIITYISIFITLILGIINFVINLNNI